MLEQQAIVTRKKGGQVYLKGMQTSACGGCNHQEGCSTSVLAKALPEKELCLSSSLDLNVGDHVIVGIEENHLVMASFLVYLLPLLLMLLVVGSYQGSEFITICLAFLSLAASLMLVHRIQKSVVPHYAEAPKILRKC